MSIKNMIIKLAVAASVLVFISGCGSDDEEDLVGNWVQLGQFEGDARADAVGVSLDGKGYVGLGYDGEDRRQDLWEYDPVNDYWVQKADFPGVGRTGAVGFAVDGKVYMGTGYDGTNKLKDFYAFDPSTNEWAQIKDFAGTARYGAVAMSIGNYGYVGTGYDGNYLKDFWKYDPSTAEWTQIVSIDYKRRDAVAFVIDNKGYVCTGIGSSGTYNSDFSVYDPSTGKWAELRDISDATDEDFDDDYGDYIKRTDAVSFVMNGKGYVATGGKSTTGGDIWEYDPSTDLWSEKTELIEDGDGGSDRTQAVGLTINNVGYVLIGRNSSYYFEDVWRFEPNSEMNEYD